MLLTYLFGQVQEVNFVSPAQKKKKTKKEFRSSSRVYQFYEYVAMQNVKKKKNKKMCLIYLTRMIHGSANATTCCT